MTRRTAPLPTGIVHFGPGAFFRAFNAVYTAEANARNGQGWGITAVSLQSPTARDQLEPQGGAFTSVTLAPEGPEYRVVETISRVLVAPEDPEAVLAALADPQVRIVSLTITEKGYCHEPATGRLNPAHPGILADLAAPGLPRTAPGFLVEGLARRRAAGLAPFVVLTCDNLPHNGKLARDVVLDFARLRDPALAAWIERHVRFPSTMVDRITPATTPADVERLAQAQGYHDPACVMHEPFRQWVIERFDGPRPAWEVAGAQIVTDVAPFETMKLRCLNGTHSTLAYLGYLAGHETIAQTVADAPFAALCAYLWQAEIIPSIPAPEGVDLAAYAEALLERYRNPAIRHRTWQIAMDGSQKLPQRLLGTVADNLAAGRPIRGLALAVAGWMYYVGGVDAQGRPIDVRDPLAAKLRAVSDGALTSKGTVAALLGVSEVFRPDLSANDRFREAVTWGYEGLVEHGPRAVVERVVQ
ncbi:MAG: mannitol dehydrogenase family protein [Rhodobacteraceae bacterium]|nr:mannitol dehydrogenase family protein [Paracoccaceae bacterium]